MNKFVILSLSIIISIGIIVGATFLENVERLAKDVKENLKVFAQESVLYFMPFFSTRLNYLVSEISNASDELVFFTEEIKGLYNECKCSNMQSICDFNSTIGFSASGGLGFETESFLGELLNGLQVELEIGGNDIDINQISRIENFKDGLGQFLENYSQELKKNPTLDSDLKELKTALENALKNDLESLKRTNETMLRSLLEQLKEQTTNILQSIAQGGCMAIGTFGDSCKNNRNEIEKKKEEISDKIEQISRLKLLLDRELEISLENELETLREDDAKELKEKLTLLQTETENLLADANKIYDYYAYDRNCGDYCIGRCTSQSNLDFQACVGFSSKQKPMQAKFDIGVELDDLNLGKIGLKFRLNLPEEFRFPTLPKIPASFIPLNASLIFNFPDIVPSGKDNIEIDLSDTSLLLSSPLAPALNFDSLNFICPDLSPYKNKTAYTWGSSSTGSKVGQEKYTDGEWYFETFSWLSEQCMTLGEVIQIRGGVSERCKTAATTTECEELKRTRGGTTLFRENQIEGCLNPQQVHLKIRSACDQGDNGQICREIGRNHTFQRADFIEKRCKEAGGGPDCNIDYYCFLPRGKTLYASEYRSDCGLGFTYTTNAYMAKEDVDRAINTLKNKCNEKKESGENINNGCKALPLITGDFPEPNERQIFEYTNIPNPPVESDGRQHFFNFSKGIPGCPVNFKTQASINFPSIIIPDIQLPSFNFCPLFAVRMPRIIFEDLNLQNLNLCDINKCLDFFPNLASPFLHLDIPQPNIDLNIPTLEVYNESVGNILIKPPILEILGPSFPASFFNFQNFFNLGDILFAELIMPSIPFPQIKVYVRFAGFDLDLTGMLIGLLKPNFNFQQCLNRNISLNCKTFGIGDKIFRWPRFPNVPKTPPFCQKISNFCTKINTELGGKIQEVKSKIEETLNNEVLGPIQRELNKLASKVQQEIINEIQNEINSLTYETRSGVEALKAELEDKIKEHINSKGYYQEGVFKIPPLVVPLKDIIGKDEIAIEEIDLQKLSGKEIPPVKSIPWPAELKDVINKDKDFSYDLPPIPLSELSWHKTYPFKIPGLQSSSFSFRNELNAVNYPGCKAETPSDTIKPCDFSRVDIKDNTGLITSTSQKIIDILR